MTPAAGERLAATTRPGLLKGSAAEAVCFDQERRKNSETSHVVALDRSQFSRAGDFRTRLAGGDGGSARRSVSGDRRISKSDRGVYRSNPHSFSRILVLVYSVLFLSIRLSRQQVMREWATG